MTRRALSAAIAIALMALAIVAVPMDVRADDGVFTSSPITHGQDGMPYEYTVTTSVDVTSWGLVSAIVNPAGDPFNARSWRVVASPDIGDAGSYSVRIKAEVGGTWYWQNYTLVIAPDLTAVFTSSPVLNATANITYEYQIGTNYTISQWNLTGPNWLAISSSGLISGTAPNGTDDSFEISIRATLFDGSIAWQNYTLSVERQPLTNQDALAMAFGLLGFTVVVSAVLGIAASARRR